MLKELLCNEITEQELLYNNNASIVKAKLPKKVYGFIFNYSVYNIIVVNSIYSTKIQKQTIIHELAHLELNHLSKRKTLLEFSICGLEDEADLYIKKIIELEK